MSSSTNGDGTSDNGDTPIVEAKPHRDSPDARLGALHQRIRQQQILAELGVTALQGAAFEKLLADTARLIAEGLRTEFCKVLEHIPSENRLLLRVGVGWEEGWSALPALPPTSHRRGICAADRKAGDFQSS